MRRGSPKGQFGVFDKLPCIYYVGVWVTKELLLVAFRTVFIIVLGNINYDLACYKE